MKKFLLLLLMLPSLVFGAATDQPLLQAGDVTYLGFFTLPDTFDAEVRGLGVSADGTQLYVGQYPSSVGLVTIPALGNEATTDVARTAVPGTIGGSSPEALEIAGIFVHNGRLIVSKRYYWDQNDMIGTTLAYGNLNISGFSSFQTIANVTYRQYVNGWIGAIPTEWQSFLGAPAFASNSLMSINSTNSNGPSFVTFDPDDVTGGGTAIPSEVLMLFPYAANNSTHMMNLDIDVANEWLVANDQENAGMIFPSGTSSVLMFYRHGTGAVCYGTAAQCSNDPCSIYHGEHGYPYQRQIMAFDANDLLAVKNGTKLYHEVEPYAEWEAPGQVDNCDSYQYSALAYDDVNRKVYVAGGDYYGTHKIYVYAVAEGVAPTPDVSITGLEATMSLGTVEVSSPNHVYLTGQEATASLGDVAVTIANSNQVIVTNLTELQAAFVGEIAGQEIIISPGTYVLPIAPLSIDVDNLIIRSSTGNREDVVILGDAMSASAAIKVVFYFPPGLGANTTIKDMTIGRVGWHAIMFNGNGAGNGSTIDNLYIYDTHEQMLKATVSTNGSDNITVKNSKFEYTAGIGPQYYIGGIDTLSADGWTIQDNEFYNILSPTTTVSNPAINPWSNTTFTGTLTIERNKIVNCDRGIGVWNSVGTVIIRNNMITSDGSGLSSDVGIDVRNSTDIEVYNNTVWITGGYPNAIEIRDAATVGIVQNNLTNIQILEINGPTIDATNNVESSQASWFVSTSTGDLHLTSAVASVVDQGTTITGLVDDYDAVTRSGSIDIGADEWVPPSGGGSANVPGGSTIQFRSSGGSTFSIQ